MASTFRLVHDFPEISVEKFEKHLNHPNLNDALDAMPAFRSRTLENERDLGDGVTEWSFRVVAGGQLPKPAQKIVKGDMLSWLEVSKFVPSEHCIYWRIEPDAFKGKFEGSGTWKLEDKAGGTRRTIEGTISVKIPIVGKIIEKFLVEEMKKNYDVEPRLQREFYATMDD